MIQIWLLSFWLASSGSDEPTWVRLFYRYADCQAVVRSRITPEAYRVSQCVPLTLRASTAYGEQP